MAADTIFALSSGRPPAAISVIRISGPVAHDAGRLLAGDLPPVRHAAVRELRDPDSDVLLDEALVLRFDGPASSTGEDVVELHCHGGRAVVEAVLSALSRVEGGRPAEPGEFTRRAFENGRIDLMEAEGLADLLEAETESQRCAALMLAEGGLSRTVDQWRQRLLALSARVEAAIDYVDEDSVDDDPELSCDCGSLAKDLGGWLERPRAELLRDGVRVVIAGPVNSGKSSLLNALCGQERAIVTDMPGTTRDHIEVPLALGGVPVRLTDTAGLRDSEDMVEQIGIDRAHGLVELADVLLWLGDPEIAPAHARRITVHSRCDVREGPPFGSVAVSSKTSEGIARLCEIIVERSKCLLPAEGEVALNRRQAECLRGAFEALSAAEETEDLVIAAESLRAARGAFDRLTGRAGVEDLLDSLFGRFCLGK
ncbi:MAG: tRNA uridine-5-carboxymethylaminomethyl(34) synthesis GTPase MnmE [Pseudomonadota bacterium]|nr:tRNA uridine-5-carboxymethylaminomethyl(34) synthesis GTPase MnmE [Pseudomonadota bacterium]